MLWVFYYSSETNLCIAYQILSLENGASLRSLKSTRVSYIFVYYLYIGVAMRACLHVASSLFKIFFPNLNILE